VRAGTGAVVTLPDGDPLWVLFGESTSRALLTCAPDDTETVLARAAERGVPARAIGRLGGSHLDVTGVLRISTDDLVRTYEGAIPALMER
jgi:phosphoribosylformylglycinamidine synthase